LSNSSPQGDYKKSDNLGHMCQTGGLWAKCGLTSLFMCPAKLKF